jgi:hypothetical protein
MDGLALKTASHKAAPVNEAGKRLRRGGSQQILFLPSIFLFPSHIVQAIRDHLWSACLHLSLAIPYRAFELSQYAIEYETRISAGIFVRHFSIHAQKRIAIFFE